MSRVTFLKMVPICNNYLAIFAYSTSLANTGNETSAWLHNSSPGVFDNVLRDQNSYVLFLDFVMF